MRNVQTLKNFDESDSTKTVLSPFFSAFTPYLPIFLLTVATFMEVLDTTIVNVAVPKISGNLSASPEETTLVISSYLVANAVILPLSGWLASYFGRKRYYMVCVFLFTLSSLFCGLSTNLGSLIFFRILQGLSGGGLAPSEQAIIADTMPPERLGRAFSIYAVGLSVAPVIGPTIGGYITDTYSWHWIFFINVPIGLISLLLVHFFVHESKKTVAARAKFLREKPGVDWVGIGLIAIGIGALEIFLEQGPKGDWFESDFVFLLAGVAFVALLVGITWEYYVKNPAVDISLFRYRNFTAACILVFAVSFVATGSIFLIPYLAQTSLGYSTMSAGMIGLPGALTLMIMLPFIGYLLDKIDARKVIFFGLFGTMLAMWNFTTVISLQVDYYTLATARVFQSFSGAFLAVSVNTAAYTDVPPDKNNSASALLNLARNSGASLSIALVVTIITRQTQIHTNYLGQHINNYNPNFTQ
ncbi:MAG: DHA2 family efflux MFS transporter permease subunit, partial [Pyrinomonadaceae bacterium]|nr:DHA2 family efflux MFS transporter permease subunit [Pyrinomonadaceae bacterium]